MANNYGLDLSTLPKELHLIIEWLKEDDRVDSTPSVNQDLCKDIDWSLFIELTLHHRVFPVLANILRKVSHKTHIPSHVMKAVVMRYQQNTLHMLHFSAEMEHISHLFSKHNIRLLFLKGPTLGHDLYGDISLRTSGDLDVLIPIEQLEQAESHLLEQGYVKDDYIKTVLNDWKWRHHHVTYFHPDKRIKLELHWRLNPGPAREPKFNELWERKRRSKLIGSRVYTLGNEDLFFFLVSHGARHGWSRLRWLLDIHKLIQKKVDWQKTYRLLKKYHAFSIGGQALILRTQLLGGNIPDALEPVVAKKRSLHLAQRAVFYLETMINLHTDPVPTEVASYHKHHLFSLMSIQQKILFIISLLHPYPEDEETLALPKLFHFLYFPLRPFLWAWRKTGRSKLT